MTYVGPGKLDDDIKEEIRAEWARLFGGSTESRPLMIVTGDWDVDTVEVND